MSELLWVLFVVVLGFIAWDSHTCVHCNNVFLTGHQLNEGWIGKDCFKKIYEVKK